MSTDKVLDKIRKLLALSRSTNEHEAANAAAKAAALMQEHQIDEARLRVGDDTKGAEPLATERLERGSTRMVPWKGRIASGLARSVGAKFYWLGGEIAIFGREGALQTVRYMFQYLVGEVERLADYAWEHGDGAHVFGVGARAWKNSFRLGASGVIYRRLVEQRQQFERQAAATAAPAERGGGGGDETSKAIAIVRKDEVALASAWAEMTAKWKWVNVKAAPHSSVSAYEQGAAAGATVTLTGGARLSAAPAKIAGRR